MRLVTLSAKMGCGKTTVAQLLTEMIPGSVVISFAGALKQEVSSLYKIPLELCYSQAGKQSIVFIGQEGIELLGAHTLQLRQVLQKHGMMRRAQDPDYWDNKMREALAMHKTAGCPCVIIDDARFEREIALAKSCGGEVYRIEAYPEWKPGPNADHISETALDEWLEWDAVFYPEKGLEQLQAVAVCIARNHTQGD